jgi:hypothetical protein
MHPGTSEREDAYYDESVGMVVTRAGKTRWRKVLAERDASRDREAAAAFVEQLRHGARPA